MEINTPGETELADGGPHALVQLDVELNSSNSSFVGIHELPLGIQVFVRTPSTLKIFVWCACKKFRMPVGVNPGRALSSSRKSLTGISISPFAVLRSMPAKTRAMPDDAPHLSQAVSS